MDQKDTEQWKRAQINKKSVPSNIKIAKYTV